MSAAGAKKKPLDLLINLHSRISRSSLLQNDAFKRPLVGTYFLYKRWWEDPFYRLTRQHPEFFKRGDVLDVGANIGYTACVFAQAVSKGSRVYAFEPDSVTFETLKKVLTWKGAGGAVCAIASAVGREEGKLRFWHNESHSADHRVVTNDFEERSTQALKIVEIAVTSVDAFVEARQLPAVSFIKIDVQGFELEVCRGMEATLNRFPEMGVCFEYSPQSMKELGFDADELLEFFLSRDYRLYLLDRSGLTPARGPAAIHSFAEGDSYADVLAIRRDLS